MCDQPRTWTPVNAAPENRRLGGSPSRLPLRRKEGPRGRQKAGTGEETGELSMQGLCKRGIDLSRSNSAPLLLVASGSIELNRGKR